MAKIVIRKLGRRKSRALLESTHIRILPSRARERTVYNDEGGQRMRVDRRFRI